MTDTSTLLEQAASAQDRFEILFSTLRERISTLIYPPGTHLSEEALANEFGISRSPLRKALKILEADGLLQSQQGVGTLVTEVDFNELSQVYQLRLELNELVGKLEPQTPDDRIRALFASMRERADLLLRQPDLKAFSRLNMDFFHAFQTLTGNQPLRDMSEKLFYQTCRIWLMLIPESNFSKEVKIMHDEIISICDCIDLGDVPAAALIRRAHLSMGYTRLGAYAQA
ncbi:MAG: GntR family transcriptional regulator [Rhodobacteraceae bacterium]|nr:GntR family transcriptional regulator [Paracoccaceae bacterium]